MADAPHEVAQDLLAGLNEPQRRAVTHVDGPLLVIAGPGSGKTRVITRRAAHLVRSGVQSRHILCITFTNKAAAEMRARIESLGVARGMWVCTFHALGVRLLREFGPLVKVEPGFSIYDEADALKAIKDAMHEAGVSETMIKPDLARAIISDAKSKLQTPARFEEQAGRFEEQLAGRVYREYQKLLEKRNAVDFDDLLMKVALVLQQREDITERLNLRFRYVQVDEYQDTNHAQYLIARALSKHHRNICVTGDPDQSIYAWRGADIRNILEFERDYPDAVVVRLEQNYRSFGHILKAASQLIRNNKKRKHKELWSELGDGEQVQAWQFAEGNEEAERIAATIAELRKQGRMCSDFAIFYRVNAVSRGLEEALRNRGIPYKIARGVEFYNRREVRDALAYLRLIVNPADDVALTRIVNTPARGIGKTTIDRLEALAATRGLPISSLLTDPAALAELGASGKKVAAFAALVDRLRRDLPASIADAVGWVIAESGLEKSLRDEDDAEGEDRLANVQELVTGAARYEDEAEDEEKSLAGFLNRVSLVSDQDAVDESAGVVMLMTLHAAKGLEFPIVFLVGMEQGMLPHERSLGTGDVEEERRLCFVGLTRAREKLIVSHAMERVIRGQFVPRSPSQFLLELAGPSVETHDFRPRYAGKLFATGRPGFVPTVEDLPADEAAELSPKRRFQRESGPEERVYVDGQAVEPEPPSRRRRTLEPIPETGGNKFAGWLPGMLVKHKTYGVGQILWIKPSPGQTRAGLKFAGYGEKTMILEFAPVELLQRK